MGCCKSKEKVDQPKKQTTQQRRTETDQDLNLDHDVRKNVEIKSSIEVTNKQKETLKERELRGAADKKKTPEKIEKPQQPAMVEKVVEKKPPPISKEEHAKLVPKAENWYKGIEALISYLKENLMHNMEETEDLAEIIDELVGYNKDLEKRLPDLKTHPFKDDKQKLKDYSMASSFIKELEAEYIHYKKKTKNYPEFRDLILGLLSEMYPDLFDVSEQPEVEKSKEVRNKTISERSFNEKSMRSPRGTSVHDVDEDNFGKVRNQYDQAFDKEMAIVMQRERDQAAFELEQQVNEYNRLMEDMNRLKNRQQNLNGNYDSTRKELRDMRNANNNLAYTNDTLQVENNTFKDIHQDMLDANLQAKEQVMQLENELYDLHRRHQQNYIDFQHAGREHESRVQELERQAADRRREAYELERIYQEDLRKLFNKEDEIQYQKARIVEQVDLNYDLRQSINAYASGSLHDNIEAVRRSYKAPASQNNIQPSPRKSVLKPANQDENLQDTISALAEAKRARVENDNNWTGTGLELKRTELYGGQEGIASRLSTLSGSLGPNKYGGLDHVIEGNNRYSNNNQGYVERSSYRSVNYGYGTRI